MAFDTQLARTIKANFAAKSFAQLQEIAKADSEETWSPEAIAAANELLVERNAGHAAEPAVPEPPPTPPAFRYDPSALAVGILGTLIGGATAGYLVYEYFRKADIAPDLPQPFGRGRDPLGGEREAVNGGGVQPEGGRGGHVLRVRGEQLVRARFERCSRCEQPPVLRGGRHLR